MDIKNHARLANGLFPIGTAHDDYTAAVLGVVLNSTNQQGNLTSIRASFDQKKIK